MAVPTAPAAGAPIAEAWGDVVHDTVVAMDLQAGRAVVGASAGFVTVTFPRAFGGQPTVVAVVEYNGASWYICNPQPSGTGLTSEIFYVRDHAGVIPSAACTIGWIAYGPRA